MRPSHPHYGAMGSAFGRLVLWFFRLLCEGGATAAGSNGRQWRWLDRERLGHGQWRRWTVL